MSVRQIQYEGSEPDDKCESSWGEVVGQGLGEVSHRTLMQEAAVSSFG